MAETWIELLRPEDVKCNLYPLVSALQQDAALWAPYHTPDDVVQMLIEDRAQLWVGGRSEPTEMHAITQLHIYPRARVLAVLWCHGTPASDYYELFTHKLERLAKMLQCDIVEIRGRQGWMRALAAYGYKPAQLIVTKDIHYGEGRIGERNADEQGGADPRAAGADVEGHGADRPVPSGRDSAAPGRAGV